MNVFEREDKKNVRIICSTAMDYEAILAFYAPVLEMMESELDMDTGKCTWAPPRNMTKLC